MASEFETKSQTVISLSRKEASDLIGLLVAQLADEPMVGNQSGACPSINVVDKGVLKYRLLFCLEPK